MKELLFKLTRENSDDGANWREPSIEAECRHFTDIMSLMKRRAIQEYFHDETGRRVHARFRVIGIRLGDTLAETIKGVI